MNLLDIEYLWSSKVGCNTIYGIGRVRGPYFIKTEDGGKLVHDMSQHSASLIDLFRTNRDMVCCWVRRRSRSLKCDCIEMNI